MAGPAIRVEGLRELNRNLAFLDKEAAKAMRDALKADVGGPVRSKASQLAVANIGNIGMTWSRMKVGARQKGIYLAPAARRRGGSARPNLGGLLVKQAMWPAVMAMRPQTYRALDAALDRLGHKADFR